ncbi:PAAR-like protein [Paenibacillus popilliae]|uniref:DUF4280 domain-containing protein n=1 Tax=Paenibacillus popilliae TaxID=78057 RepID=A0ABY3AJF8_PAEPP|nr:PAAR-like protein [Paenibacillus sp. SDF0028]TQR41806.1 DUF4280 domain-containing protein [Paenibacillus sp. SDF0028]
MARDIEYLLLCKDVYLSKDLKKNRFLHQEKTLDGVQVFGVKRGEWEVIEFAKDELKELITGFYGAVYFNKKINEFVITMRGTDNWFGGNDPDITENTKLIWETPQTVAVRFFLGRLAKNEIFKKAKNAKVSFTGHSLGGKLAQKAFWEAKMGMYDVISPDQVTKAVTFNSAGAFISVNTPFKAKLEKQLKSLPVYNYVIEGEVLQHAPGKFLGKRYVIPYSRYSSDGTDLVSRHNAIYGNSFQYYMGKDGNFGSYTEEEWKRRSFQLQGTSIQDEVLCGGNGSDTLIAGSKVTYMNGGGNYNKFIYKRASGTVIIQAAGSNGFLEIQDYNIKDLSYTVFMNGVIPPYWEIYLSDKKKHKIKIEDFWGMNGPTLSYIKIQNSSELYTINVRSMLGYYKRDGKNGKTLPSDKQVLFTELPKDVLYRNDPKAQSSSKSIEMQPYVVAGATMKCNCGSSTSRLKVEKSHGVYIRGKVQLNVNDYKPKANIESFGLCSSRANPDVQRAGGPVRCNPNVATSWIYGKKDMLVGKQPALLNISQNSCMYQGTIRIVDNGQLS